MAVGTISVLTSLKTSANVDLIRSDSPLSRVDITTSLSFTAASGTGLLYVLALGN